MMGGWRVTAPDLPEPVMPNANDPQAAFKCLLLVAIDEERPWI